MKTLVQTFCPADGREYVEPHRVVPRMATHGVMPARVAVQSVKARVRETNRRQNFVRWSVDRTSIAGTWNPATLYPVLFDTEHYAQDEYKGRKVHCVPERSWRFQCGEPGIYNVKGHVTMLISYPAIPATKIQRVILFLRHKSFKTNALTYFEQSQEIANCGVAAGMTVAHYLRGWSLPIRDKVVLEAGDELEVYWQFQGIGISFIDEYNAFIAIQRTGEAYIHGSCCHG